MDAFFNVVLQFTDSQLIVLLDHFIRSCRQLAEELVNTRLWNIAGLGLQTIVVEQDYTILRHQLPAMNGILINTIAGMISIHIGKGEAVEKFRIFNQCRQDTVAITLQHTMLALRDILGVVVETLLGLLAIKVPRLAGNVLVV